MVHANCEVCKQPASKVGRIKRTNINAKDKIFTCKFCAPKLKSLNGDRIAQALEMMNMNRGLNGIHANIIVRREITFAEVRKIDDGVQMPVKLMPKRV